MLNRAEFLAMCGAALVGAGFASRAWAQSPADFYRGRTVTLVIPTASGGINNLSGRLVARHLGRFIPGNPNVVAMNRESDGGLGLANSFAAGAPKDGASTLSSTSTCRVSAAANSCSRGVAAAISP